MKVKNNDGIYNIEDIRFSDITNLLMILKEVQADINSDCYYTRQELIKKIDNCVYGFNRITKA